MKVDPDTVWPTLEQARQALKEGDGAGIKVAIIDSGIDTSHPQLAGIDLADDEVITCDGMRINFEKGEKVDVYGHGTAVAGILLEEVPRVTVGSFRALDTQIHSRSFVIAEAVHLAISRGYHIINCSFGCRGQSKFVMEYKEWVDLAYLNGIQIVAACSNLESGIREWPAYFPSVFGVRAIDCSPEKIYHQKRQMISFMAQGERVKVPWLGGITKIETGSSFAAPRLAGKIAKILSVFPNLDPGAVKPLLANLAEPYMS